MSRTGQLKKTAKHTAIYTVGTILRRITGLVMLPIYTRYLTPADYGVVELLGMAIEIAGILVGLRIAQALFRYYILAEDEFRKKQIVSTVLLTIMASSAVGSSIMLLFAEQLTVAIFGDNTYVFEFRLFTLTLVTNAISAVGLSYLRARQMPIFFVSVGIITLALQVLLNVVFVVMMELHVTGVVYSALISGAVVALGLSAYVFTQAGFHYSTSIAANLIRYITPLIAASIGAFYVAYADKYFLRLFGSLTEVGLYALAARVSSVLSTGFEAFNMSWGADRFEIVKKDNAREIYEQVFRFMAAIMIAVAAGLAMFANDFFRIMTSPEFFSAGYIVPILVIAMWLRVITIFCNFGALYSDKTRIIAEASWGKVIFASAGYITLIPLFGVYGAAATLMLSNLLELLWVHRQSSKLYDMRLKWGPVILCFLAATAFVAPTLLMPAGEWDYFAVRAGMFFGLLLVMFVLPIWSEDDRAMMKGVYRSALRLVGVSGRS